MTQGATFKQQSIAISTTAAYSDKIGMRLGTIFSAQFDWLASNSLTVTLWQSNKEAPDLTDDTDWVENTDLTLPTADTTGKGFANASAAGARWYRYKFVLTAGGTDTLTLDVAVSKGA